MNHAKVSRTAEATSSARRSVPTARWVPTVGPDGRRRLTMQWSVAGRALDVPAPRAA